MRKRGFVQLWRGAPAMVVACVPSHAAYFSVYEKAKQLTGANQPGHHPVAAAMSGAMATTLHDAILTPMDVVKQRLQLGFYGGVLDSMRRIVREEGARALYRSYPTTVLMNIPYAGVLVASNESIKQVLNPTGVFSMPTYLLAGALAGACAAAVTTPLDVLKTRLQTQGLGLVVNEAPQTGGPFGIASSVKPPHPPAPEVLNGAASASSMSGSAATAAAASAASPSQALANGGPRAAMAAAAAAASSSSPLQSVSAAASQGPGAVLGAAVGRPFLPAGVIGTVDRTAVLREIRYEGLWDAAAKVARAEGFAGLFRGVGARVMVNAPSAAISWGTYEAIKSFLGRVWP